MLLLAGTATAHAEFSAGQLTAIAEHVYRGSSKIRSCETVCSSLWSKEEGAESKELTLELLDLRQEVGLLPTIASPYASVELTSTTRTVHWGVPGERPMIITITRPGRSEPAYWCNEECVQALHGYAEGESPGYFKSPLPEDALVWTWTGPLGTMAGRLQPIEGYCEGHPTIPKVLLTMAGPQTSWCYPGATEEVGYWPQPFFVTSTSIREESKELPYTFQTSGAKREPSLGVLKEELASDLTPAKYPYLVQWYHYQFGEGCNPERCEVPKCRALTLEACEALLRETGFTNLAHSTETEGNTDFYVGPADVTRTSPAAGTEAVVTAPMHIDLNPVESTWNDRLLRRYEPTLWIQEEEEFEPDSVELMTNWNLNALKRQHGKTIYEPHTSFLGANYADEEPAASEDLIDSVSGLTSEKYTPSEEAVYIVEQIGQPQPEQYLLKVYAHVVDEPGSNVTWLQYWFFYYYNPPSPGAEEFAQHEGDWEMAQLAIDGGPASGLEGESSEAGPGPNPAYLAAAEHTKGSTCSWSHAESLLGVPQLFAALDSHATYFAPGEYETGFPLIKDYTNVGIGTPIRGQVVMI
jgi:hypothetical protein